MVMNNDAPDTTSRWVDDRLRALDPPDTWEPATNIALARFHERAAAAAEAPRSRAVWAWPRPWLTAASAACFLILILMLVPATRATAQRLWDVFFAERIEFVALDVDRLPRSFTDQRIDLIGPSHMQVAGLQEAVQHARFTPRLPDPAVIGSGNGSGIGVSIGIGRPTLAVTGAISLESRVNAADLQDAARNVGLTDVHFPSEWDGARLGIHGSPMVIATYPSFELIQLMPLAITTPPGFDLGAFTERVLRVGGLSPSAARTFSKQMATAPFALFAVGPDEKMTMRQVRLRAGEGTIVHDLDEDGGPQRATLVWSTSDRLYVISSNLSDDEAMAIADAIPER